jgi:RND superfamily putative drug exporter
MDASAAVQRAFGPGATGPLQIVTPAANAAMVTRIAQGDPGVAALMPTQTANGYALITAIPTQDPSNPAVGQAIDRLRSELPNGTLIGGAVVENHDLQAALSAKTPLVIGVVLALGFLLPLIALQAPLLAAVGVLTNLLATARRSASPNGSSRAGLRTRCSGSPRRGSSTRGGRCSSSR